MTPTITTNRFQNIAALFNRINQAAKVCDLVSTADLTVAELVSMDTTVQLFQSLILSPDESRGIDRKLTTLVLTEMKELIERSIEHLSEMGITVDGNLYASYVQDPEEL